MVIKVRVFPSRKVHLSFQIYALLLLGSWREGGNERASRGARSGGGDGTALGSSQCTAEAFL